MAEYIERQAAMNKFAEVVAPSNHSDFQRAPTWNDAVDIIENFPPADVRHVIFCRDCKHMGWIQEPCHGKSIDYCRALEHPVDRLFFCGMGERKGANG